MTGGDALIATPNGTTAFGPIAPRTWSAKERARAKQLEADVAGAIAWHRNRPFFQGLQTVAASIPSATFTPITLDTEMIDSWGGHSGSGELWYPPFTADTGTITDFYLCSGYVPLDGSDATKVGSAALIHNGTEIREGTKIPHVGGHVIDPMVIDLVGVTGGTDTISLAARTTLAAGCNTVVSAKCPSLTIRWVATGATSGIASPLPPVPHTWIPADQASATTTGASTSPGGAKVAFNTEIRDAIRFLNYPPMARLTSEGSSQSIPTGGAFTSIQFPLNNVDNYGGWTSGANTKYTVQRAGLYFVAGYASVGEVTAAGGYRAVRLLVTAAGTGITTPYGGTSAVPQTAGSSGTALYAVRHLRLGVGDTIEVQFSNTGTSALPVNVTAAGASRLIAIWRGR